MHRYVAKSGGLEDEIEEAVGVLPASLLNRAGVFNAPIGDMFSFNVEGMQVRVRVEVVHREVSIGVEPYVGARLFSIVAATTPFGCRYRFRCPYTQKQVDRLIVYYNSVSTVHELGYTVIREEAVGETREALAISKLRSRLNGDDGRGPARGENRLRLAARLQTLTGEGGTSAISKSAKVRFRQSDMSEHGTAKALGRAAYLSPAFVFALFKQDADNFESSTGSHLSGTTLTNDFANVADFPVLSIDKLSALWREEVECWHLSWPKFELESVPIYAVRRHDGGAVLMIKLRFDPKAATIVILVRKGNQTNPKTYMRCPVNGSWVSHLYYRDGRFASAKAQRLGFPSEMAKGLR